MCGKGQGVILDNVVRKVSLRRWHLVKNLGEEKRKKQSRHLREA